MYTKEEIELKIKPLLYNISKPKFINLTGKLGEAKKEFTTQQRQTFEEKIIPASVNRDMKLMFIGTYGKDALIRLMNTPNIPIVDGMMFIPKKDDIYYVYENGDIGTISSFDLYTYASKNDYNYIQNNLNLLIL